MILMGYVTLGLKFPIAIILLNFFNLQISIK